MGRESSPEEQVFKWHKTRYEKLRDGLRAYGQSPQSIIPAGSGFKVESARGARYLKRFRYGPRELWFLYYCLEHLRGRGFPGAPRVYLTLAGQPYIEVDGEVYYLQDWLELTRPEFADPGTLKACVDLMAAIHRAGEGFVPPAELSSVRVQYGSWLDKCIRRLREIYGFAELAEEDAGGRKFDKRYAKAAPVFFRHAEDAVRRLAELPLADLAEEERRAGAVCHRNFTPRNIALDHRSNLRVLDFDNCAREIRLDDLAGFIRRCAYLDLERAAFIVQCYGEARGREVSAGELALISAYLLFPREFWIVGRSRFHRDHRRERLLRRLVRNAGHWERFTESIASLKTAVFPAVIGPAEAGARPQAALSAEVAVPEGPEQPSVPAGIEAVQAAAPLELWRADDVQPAIEPEEVSEMEKSSWQAPEAEEEAGVEVPEGVGTVPAHFPEGVEPFATPVAVQPAPPQAEAGEPAAAEPAGEPAAAEPTGEPAEAEPAEEPAEERALTDDEYRTVRGSLATTPRTLVWGKWPKPLGPKDEGPGVA